MPMTRSRDMPMLSKNERRSMRASVPAAAEG
jgi:hypothetical protein